MSSFGFDASLLNAPGAGSGGDIDVVASGVPRWWPLGLQGARLCQILRYDVTGWYWILDVDGRPIAVDTLVDPRGIGKYAFPIRASEARLQDLEPAPPAVRAAYLALKRLRKGDRSTRAWAAIAGLAGEDPAGTTRLLTEALGNRAGRALADASLQGHPPDPRSWRRLRGRQRRARIRGVRGGVELAWAMAARWVGRIVQPSGLVVAVVGPDGAGKSTLAERLPEATSGLFRRSTRVHFRPGLLPSRASLRGETGPVTEPHALPSRGAVASLLFLGYHFADWLLGGWMLLEPRRRRSDLVVLERGWWDLAVDPRRYRVGLPPALVEALGRVLPKPDLVLVLDAPAAVMHARKPELPTEELERQRRAWHKLRIPRAEKVVLDATRPVEEVLAGAREAVVVHLERRAVRRLAAGWVNLSGRSAPRWWVPRGPAAAARSGLAVYQPVTPRGRAGWEAARALARLGGFRLLPRGEAPPREVRVRLAPHLSPGTTYAVMRANHTGRYVALLVGEDGRARAVAKVATTPEAEEALRREARAIATWGGLLRPPLRAPSILAEGDGVLLLEAVTFRARRRPWVLPPAVARAVGALEREGVSHGDLAPWNLLEGEGGYVLVDWESAGPLPAPAWDLCHWLVQAHALLGRPRRGELLAALEGLGPFGEAVAGYLAEASVPLEELSRHIREHLERSRSGLDPRTPDGLRGLRAREALLHELGGRGGPGRA